MSNSVPRDPMDQALEAMLNDAMSAQAARHRQADRLARYQNDRHLVADVMHTARSYGLHVRQAGLGRRRPLPPFHEDAFEVANRAWHERYQRAVERAGSRDEESFHEAVAEANEAFLASYLEQVTL